MNEAVLVLMLFLTDPSGNPTELKVVTQSFETMEQCNLAGKNFRQLYKQETGESIPSYIKTISTCVHYTNFRKPV